MSGGKSSKPSAQQPPNLSGGRREAKRRRLGDSETLNDRSLQRIAASTIDSGVVDAVEDEEGDREGLCLDSMSLLHSSASLHRSSPRRSNRSLHRTPRTTHCEGQTHLLPHQ